LCISAGTHCFGHYLAQCDESHREGREIWSSREKAGKTKFIAKSKQAVYSFRRENRSCAFERLNKHLKHFNAN
jgi:hypothetical protein